MTGRMSRLVLLLVAGSLACSAGGSDADRRRRRAETAAPVDTVIPVDVRQAFTPPDAWERVQNAGGLTFRQPAAFTLGLDARPIEPCDENTPGADSAIFDKTFMERWPLTLAMRRGDVNRIARTNGFTLDSTEVGTHGSAGGHTTVKRGEGWILLSGETAADISVMFAAVRHPAGCHLVWAARGADLDPDTLAMVLSTVRFTQ
jgi:hypothetical protein